MPDKTSSVGVTKSSCNDRTSKEYVSPPEINVQNGSIGVLAPGGFQVKGATVTDAPDVPAYAPNNAEGAPTVTSVNDVNLVADIRFGLSAVAVPAKEMVPSIARLAFRVVCAANNAALAAMAGISNVFIS